MAAGKPKKKNPRLASGRKRARQNVKLNAANTFTGAVSAPVLNLNNMGTSAMTVTGAISGVTSGINILNNSTGTVNLNGTISGSGGLTIVNNGAVGTVVKLAGANNTFTGATSVTGGTLQLDLATQANNKLSDTASLTLNRAILNITGGSVSETVGSLALGAGFIE